MNQALDAALSILIADPWLALAPFGAVLGLTVLARTVAGATPAELWRTKFHEVYPARAVILTVLASLWGAVALGVVIALRSAAAAYRTWDASDAWDGPMLATCAAALVATYALHRLRRAWSERVVHAARGAPPRVDCSLTRTDRGIEPGALATLGFERFPHHHGVGWRAGLWMRALLAALLLAAAYGRTTLQPAHTVDLAAALAGLPISAEIGVALAWVGACTFLIFAAADRHYLVTKFTRRLLLLLAAAGVAAVGVARCGGIEAGLTTAAWACGLTAWRLLADLRTARRHVVRQRALGPVEAAVREATPFLTRFAGDPGCGLPTLDLAERERRVAQGAENLAEAGVLVARRFGRFLRVGELDHVRCDAAFLRMLTVDRWVATSGGWPTSLPLGGHTVPVWDESLFPVRPPRGFVDWDDPLPLAAVWNIVCSCGTCGGSGQVQVTESYTEYQNGQSVQCTRTVWRTCSRCGGTGRLEHPRVLVTGWRRLLPGVVAPHVGTHELIEDALERAFVHRPIVEDRARVAGATTCTAQDPELRALAETAAERMASDLDKHAERAVRALGGTLYRADFVIGAFHTVRIRFGSFANRVGWFFGARPEFHFPRLPLAWSVLGCAWTLPPALVWCGAQLIEMWTNAMRLLP